MGVYKDLCVAVRSGRRSEAKLHRGAFEAPRPITQGTGLSSVASRESWIALLSPTCLRLSGQRERHATGRERHTRNREQPRLLGSMPFFSLIHSQRPCLDRSPSSTKIRTAFTNLKVSSRDTRVCDQTRARSVCVVFGAAASLRSPPPSSASSACPSPAVKA